MSLLEEERKFWTALFEENNLTLQLPILADDKIDGIVFSSSHSDSVKVKAVRATALGDNFMSDTFLIKTSSETKENSSRSAFVKVRQLNGSLRI